MPAQSTSDPSDQGTIRRLFAELMSEVEERELRDGGDESPEGSLRRRLEELRALVDSTLRDGPETERRLPIRLPVVGRSQRGLQSLRPEDSDPIGFLHSVIESLDMPFLVIDAADRTVRMANEAARACAAGQQTYCYEMTHHRASPCDGKSDPCPLQSVVATGRPCRVEHVHFDRNGQPRHVEVHGHPVFDGEGRVVQMIEYSIDITERKRAERALLETRDLLVFAMAKLTESRDPETGAHLERMRSYSMILAEELGCGGPYCTRIDKEFLEDLYRASPLHDIGKVGIPDAILLKPGQLTADEFEIMRQHATIGGDAIDKIVASSTTAGFLRMAAEIARGHHERFDGSGYPTGLKGEEIPLGARIVAVADVFDALSSARVYKAAFEPLAAKGMIVAESGKHFDPVIVRAFERRWDDIMEVHKALGVR